MSLQLIYTIGYMENIIYNHCYVYTVNSLNTLNKKMISIPFPENGKMRTPFGINANSTWFHTHSAPSELITHIIFCLIAMYE